MKFNSKPRFDRENSEMAYFVILRTNCATLATHVRADSRTSHGLSRGCCHVACNLVPRIWERSWERGWCCMIKWWELRASLADFFTAMAGTRTRGTKVLVCGADCRAVKRAGWAKRFDAVDWGLLIWAADSDSVPVWSSDFSRNSTVLQSIWISKLFCAFLFWANRKSELFGIENKTSISRCG